ncbi:DUF4012 domain-containing protein [Patescibacteria group bacterium]|nr:DUF4012 domain-containing protein [Patescibacteria group bacterium]
MALKNLNKKLTKIDLNQRSQGKAGKKLLIKIVIALVILGLAIGLPVRSIMVQAKQLSAASKVLSAGLKSQDLDQIKTGLADTKTAVDGINTSLKWLIWIRPIPFVGGYYADAQHFAKAGSLDLQAAQIMVDQLEPRKTELGLNGQAPVGQDRIAQAVKILNAVLPQTDKIQPLLHQARGEVDSIDTSKYPASFRGTSVRSKVELGKQLISGVDVLLTDNKDLLQMAPQALGSDQQKTYLLLFQNDKELRATGGFITAYAFLDINKGKFTTSSSDDIYRLDERLIEACQSKICDLKPPAPIVAYLPEVDGKPRGAWSMRDSNLSPDLPTSAQQFERMYKMLGTGLPFDGIITIDTQVVEDLISITGPIDVYGTTYSANTDPRCNCANVIYELEHYSEIAAQGETDRKAILGTLMQQILSRSLSAGPDQLPTLIQTGINLANDKHIMFYMHDQNLESALAKLNWTGQILSSQGDYLHLNDSNFAGGKSNLYVEENVTMEINIGKDGQVTNTVTIDYNNPQPYNTWLNAINRDYVRLYVPSGSKLVNSSGSDIKVTTQTDDTLNKTYFEAFITVRPQNSRQLSFEYTLPKTFSGKTYPLLIQKQPGTKDFHYTIKINGKQKAAFDLTTDKTLDLAI